MGGYGSGRKSYRQKAEDCRSLDVNRFHREGCLTPGGQGWWVWSRDGEEVGRIRYRAEEERLVLDYRVRQYGGGWEAVRQPVPISYAPCHYGGKRPYFLCSGVVRGRHCNRRAVKLYSGGKFFLCRQCYNLVYTSQAEARYDRMLRRANKLRRALGGRAGAAHSIAKRPKGMWGSTYRRICDEIISCENEATLDFLQSYGEALCCEEKEMLLDGLFWASKALEK